MLANSDDLYGVFACHCYNIGLRYLFLTDCGKAEQLGWRETFSYISDQTYLTITNVENFNELLPESPFSSELRGFGRAMNPPPDFV